MSNKAVFEELVTLLSSGISRAKLYFSTHPRVREVSDTFAQGLAQVLAEAGKDKIFLGMVDGKLVHDGRYLIGPTIVGGRLVDFLANLGSGGLLFREQLEGKDVAELLRLAAETSEPVESLELRVTAEKKKEGPAGLAGVKVEYVIRGKGLSPEKIEKAVRLSEEKYCTVGGALTQATPITHEITIEETS